MEITSQNKNITQYGIFGMNKDLLVGVSYCKYSYLIKNKKDILDFINKRKQFLIKEIEQLNSFSKELE